MKSTDPPNHPSTSADWLPFGNIELPAGSAGEPITGWLSRTLKPLNLRADTLGKVISAAQAAALRARQGEPGGQTARLSVFIPLKHAFEGQNWGFFLIEKIKMDGAVSPLASREVELFLYQEGL